MFRSSFPSRVSLSVLIALSGCTVDYTPSASEQRQGSSSGLQARNVEAGELVSSLRSRFTVTSHVESNAPGHIAEPATPVTALREAIADTIERDGIWLRPKVSESIKRGVSKPAKVLLPAKANGVFRLTDETSGTSVEVAMKGAREVDAEITSGYAIYRGAHESGADVIHRPGPEGTEDWVHFAQAPARPALEYTVHLARGVEGLRLVSNTLEMLDAEGAPRLRMSPPWLIDANGERREASVDIDGCSVDTDPRGPWGRPVTAAGASECTVRVSWAKDAVYPVLVDPSWTATGSTSTPRVSQTATTLLSGRVLLAGGHDGTSPLLAGELYDSATGTFSSTGALAIGRESHSASLLASGAVLVTGGRWTSAIAAGEIYDPTTGTFSLTGSLVTARQSHTATVLISGDVLVVGGYNTSGTYLAAAELFDAVSGTYATTGPMSVARAGHTASRLGSGKVLIAGGISFGTPLASADLFDPANGTFLPTGAMSTARFNHAASALNSGNALVVGGAANGVVFSSAEIYDQATSAFSPVGSLLGGRFNHTASVLSTGRVLVVGGQYSNTGFYAIAEMFDPGLGTFSISGSIATPRWHHSASVIDSDNVLVAGGLDTSSNYLSTAERFAPFPNGSPCSTVGECASGYCSDGYCCDSICNSGGCDRCDVAGYIGTCTTALAGNPGANPACVAPFVCDGVNSGCTTCVSNAGCAAGHTCDPAGTCKLIQGQPCPGGPSTCSSGFCIDGYCCDTSCSSGSCDRCDLGASSGTCSIAPVGSLGAPDCPTGHVCDGIHSGCLSCTSDAGCVAGYTCDSGVCKVKTGQPCPGGASTCQTGYCANGVCCDTACDGGSCDRCDLAGSLGSCVIAPLGNVGANPPCASDHLCDGAGASCLSCSSDLGCVTTDYCAADGSCKPQKAQSDPCDESAGQDCFGPGCRVCSTGHCVDGYCCDSSCDGSCNACAHSSGASADGICSVVAQGKPGVPLCAPYVCNGASPNCPAGCVNNGDCALNAYCQGGSCHGSAQPGDACAVGAECASNFCVDHVCCDQSCTGQCEACDSPNHEGTCVPVSDPPHGDRLPCDGAGSMCEGHCNGAVTTACSYPGQGTSCSNPTCTGDVLFPAGLCDGAGVCQTQTTQNCAPYTCDPASDACKVGCSTTLDCAGGAVCDANGKCAISGATCQDATTAKSPDGTLTSCDPYRCLNGQCKSTCSTTSDCAPGATCDGGQCTTGTAGAGGTSGTAGTAGASGTSGTSGAAGSSNPAAAPASGDSGGCSVPSGSRGSSGGVLLIAAIAAAVSRRRRAG